MGMSGKTNLKPKPHTDLLFLQKELRRLVTVLDEIRNMTREQGESLVPQTLAAETLGLTINPELRRRMVPSFRSEPLGKCPDDAHNWVRPKNPVVMPPDVIHETCSECHAISYFPTLKLE